MTTQGQHPASETVENEILREIGNIRMELIGFKRLVLIQLEDMKKELRTRTDALLPQPPREMTSTGTSDNVMEPPAAEDSSSEFAPAGASLPEASASARRETPDQSVLPDAQDGGRDREMTPLVC